MTKPVTTPYPYHWIKGMKEWDDNIRGRIMDLGKPKTAPDIESTIALLKYALEHNFADGYPGDVRVLNVEVLRDAILLLEPSPALKEIDMKQVFGIGQPNKRVVP